MVVHHFTCPYCWETITMLFDNSATNQVYVEDCEVCCNPIQITITFFNSELIDFQADSI